jgi:hypothetical protein
MVTMPKWGVHYLIMRKAIDELESDQSLSAKNKKAISSIKSEESLALIGSVGPDILFLHQTIKMLIGCISFIKIYKMFWMFGKR